MHRVKRIFLLAGLGFAIIVPFLNTGIQFNSQSKTINEVTYIVNLSENISSSYTWKEIMNLGLWIAYLTVSISLFVRFIINLINIIKQIRNNETRKYKDYTIVLIRKKIAPHSFFKYIFLSKKDYLNNNIPDSIIAHEITHAKQKHSIDIILIELLKIFWWFNPLIYFWKSSMQLNHEFLADENVVRNNVTEKYQRLLLQFATSPKNIYLASNINYQITKKRFKMMKKKTSHWRKFLKAISLLPTAVILMLVLGNTANAQNQKEYKSINTKDKYFEKATIRFLNEDGSYTEKPYSKLTKEEKEKMPPPPPPPPSIPGNKNVKELLPLRPGQLVTITPDNGVRIKHEKEIEVEHSFPPPPPPPPPPSGKVRGQGMNPPPPPPPPREKIIRMEIETKDSMAPPPPPPPKTLEELIEESKTIFLNGKKISKKEARKKLDKIKSKKKLDIKTDGKTLNIDTEN